jgi:hypothetical protein
LLLLLQTNAHPSSALVDETILQDFGVELGLHAYVWCTGQQSQAKGGEE